jgi:integrase
MPRKAKELSALQVARLTHTRAVGGVDGLYLQAAKGGIGRSWVLVYSINGRRREHGLGSYPEVGLADAREATRVARALVRQGIDPIDNRKAARSALAATQAASKTFDECAAAYIKSQEPGWRNLKHGAQWRTTLATYASPIIGSLLVQDIAAAHVKEVLEDIWITKHETATRVRSRIENVLDYSIACGYRDGPNPARMKANLAKMLAPSNKVAKVVHHRALDVDAMPAFMTRLLAAEGQGAKALTFVILTAARSGEVRGATWSEIDLARQLWTVPAGRMKGEREHRVPLSEAALALLRSLPTGKSGDLVFPSANGRALSDMTLSAVLRRLEVDAVPHGFRSTFRVWGAERTNIPREIVEAALAHKLTDPVEAAYQRSDLVAKRQALMQAWGIYCTTPAKSANVTPIRKGRRRE